MLYSLVHSFHSKQLIKKAFYIFLIFVNVSCQNHDKLFNYVGKNQSFKYIYDVANNTDKLIVEGKYLNSSNIKISETYYSDNFSLIRNGQNKFMNTNYILVDNQESVMKVNNNTKEVYISIKPWEKKYIKIDPIKGKLESYLNCNIVKKSFLTISNIRYKSMIVVCKEYDESTQLGYETIQVFLKGVGLYSYTESLILGNRKIETPRMKLIL